ncbi:MAG: cobalamin biosynthesis protein [Magnetococcales bacterium]|nr:cobalamin biosynthesis protein [Magnetococcales bacterium]
MTRQPALVAIGKRGAGHARQLASSWPGATLYVLEPWATPDATPLPRPLRDHVARLMEQHDPVCFFCALGATVRLIAPHLRSKRQDPAVVCVDETARFVIPVVSGHLGGANHHARVIAGVLAALPVITTASDNLDLPAVDLLGRELGWRIEAEGDALTRCAAALVNDQPMALLQECSARLFSLPNHLEEIPDLADADPARHCGLLWITHRPDARELANHHWPHPCVIYRPPHLTVGMGCDRGTSLATLRAALDLALARLGIPAGALTGIATIDRKQDETGLLELARQLGLACHFFAAEQLKTIPTPHPSALVEAHMGTPSVAEAAALLACPGAELILSKTRHRGTDGKNVTIAIARKEFTP